MIAADNSLVTFVDVSTSAGNSSSATIKNLGAGGVVYATTTNNLSGNTSGTSAGNNNASATSATVNNAALVDAETGDSITNATTSGPLAVLKGFSTDALF